MAAREALESARPGANNARERRSIPRVDAGCTMVRLEGHTFPTPATFADVSDASLLGVVTPEEALLAVDPAGQRLIRVSATGSNPLPSAVSPHPEPETLTPCSCARWPPTRPPPFFPGIVPARPVTDTLQQLARPGAGRHRDSRAAQPRPSRDSVSGSYLDGLERAGIPVRCEPAGNVRAPPGDDVLVTTIHQAKGREWDVVIVGSLSGPDLATDRIGRNLPDCGVYSGEPEGLIADFDRARQHYVAFTRARHLLVLTASGEPQARFRSIWDDADRWPSVDREALSRQRFGVAGAVPQRTVEIGHLDRLVVRLAPPG